MSNTSFFNSDDFFAFAVIVMLLQFIVGVVQIIGAFIRTLIRLTNSKPLGNLKIYWIMVAAYFFVFLLLYMVYLYLDATSHVNIWEVKQEKLGDIELLVKVAYGWFFTAWIIAVWYNIKVVFYKEPIEVTQDAGFN